MLLEIDVRDFAIIEQLRLDLEPGFNVITGETGAGKSIVIDALGLLLGERADPGAVRSGADRAILQGVFDAGKRHSVVTPVLEEYGVQLEQGEALIISREVHAAGRSTARINGINVPARALAALGRHLVDIHGQSDNAALKREAEHLDLLDRYAGLGARRRALAQSIKGLQTLDRELALLRSDDEAKQRRADLLTFALDEIDAAQLSETESDGLLAERNRLANAEKLARLSEEAYVALSGGLNDEIEVSGLDLVDRGMLAVTELARIDADMQALSEDALAATEALRDAAAQVRDYRDSLEFSPDRLEEVEERLALIGGLKRKYGPEVSDVLDYAQRAADELEGIRGSDKREAALTRERDALLVEIGSSCSQLAKARRKAGKALALAVESELESLNMQGGRFEPFFEVRPSDAGVLIEAPGYERDQRYAFDDRGADKMAFGVSLNAGEPPRPLARVASGGETARLMLALRRILSAADGVPSLIFDEIDAGIGGRMGSVVGQKLWGLAEEHQVICVTHLPQVAAFADTHFRVQKDVRAGRTTTSVAPLAESERVEELMLMQGANTSIARENALQMLQGCQQWKRAAVSASPLSSPR